jgi:hypothetical protein
MHEAKSSSTLDHNAETKTIQFFYITYKSSADRPARPAAIWLAVRASDHPAAMRLMGGDSQQAAPRLQTKLLRPGLNLQLALRLLERRARLRQ